MKVKRVNQQRQDVEGEVSRGPVSSSVADDAGYFVVEVMTPSERPGSFPTGIGSRKRRVRAEDVSVRWPTLYKHLLVVTITGKRKAGLTPDEIGCPEGCLADFGRPKRPFFRLRGLDSGRGGSTGSNSVPDD
jgi:hypothetical protein